MTLTQISTAGVKDDAVTSGKIPANAVGTSEIANNAVNVNKIADANVTAAKLDSNCVTTAKIQDQAVTLAKLPHGTSSNDGKFLRANNGADPTFETVTSTTINGNTNNNIVTATGTANTLQGESNLTFDGSNLLAKAGESEPASLNLIADQGDDNGDGWKIQSEQDENDLTFKSNISGSYVDKLKLKNTGQLEVQGNLVGTGNINITGELTIGGSDLNMIGSSDGNRYFDARVGSDSLQIRATSGGDSNHETMAKFFGNGGVELYHDGTPRFITTSNGIKLSNLPDNHFLLLDQNGRQSSFNTYFSTGSTASRIGIDISQGQTDGTKTRSVDFWPDGMSFNGETATANKIDDYEEGTWTPSAVQGVSSVSFITARYTRIGRQVFLTARFTPSGSSNSSSLNIGGLPFQSGSQNQNSFSIMHNGLDEGGSPEPVPHGHISANTSTMSFYYSRTAGVNWAAITGSEAVNHEFIFATHYYTDA